MPVMGRKGGMGEEEETQAEAEAWSVLAGGNSTAQRLRDDFAQAAGLPEPEPEPELAAGTELAVLAPRAVGAAVERTPDEIDWPLVTRSLSAELCTAPDATGSLMLHRLAAKRAPLQTVQAALEAFPEALHERTAAGNLAYDLAVAAGAEPAVVDTLFIGHLQAMGELDELKSVLRDEGGERGLSRQAQEVLASAAKSRARLCEIDSDAAKKLGLSIVDRRLLGELISGSRNLRRVQQKQAMAVAPGAARPELPLELALKHRAPGVVVTRLMEEQPAAHGTSVEGAHNLVLAHPPAIHLENCSAHLPPLVRCAQGIYPCTGPLKTRLHLRSSRLCSQVSLALPQPKQKATTIRREKLLPTATALSMAFVVSI